VQQNLFHGPAEVDMSVDSYAPHREAARRLMGEFVIDECEAFDLVLAYGSETAVRKALVQRWYRDEIELHEEAA